MQASALSFTWPNERRSERRRHRQRQPAVADGEARDIMLPALKRVLLSEGMFHHSKTLQERLLAVDGANAAVRQHKGCSMPTYPRRRRHTIAGAYYRKKRCQPFPGCAARRDR
jgi:hypothetical protein